MTDCKRCKESFSNCRCVELKLKDYFCWKGHQFNQDEIKTGRLCPFCEKEKEIKCYDHNKAMHEYQKQMEKAQDNLINCLINGCRNFEMRCKDCGEVVGTSVLSLNDENKQSSPQIPT